MQALSFTHLSNMSGASEWSVTCATVEDQARRLQLSFELKKGDAFELRKADALEASMSPAPVQEPITIGTHAPKRQYAGKPRAAISEETFFQLGGVHRLVACLVCF